MQPLEMERVNLQFYKDKNPPSDLSQVPAAAATYSVFRQGASLSSGVFISSSSTYRIPLYSLGHVRIDDTLQLARDLSMILIVVDLDPAGKWIDVQYDYQGQPLSLAAGDRLIPINSPPTLFADFTGSTALGSNVVTLDNAGRATFFCRFTIYDAVLVGAGPTRVLLDQRGGWATELNAADFSSIQAAVNALPPSGGTVFVPGGTWSDTEEPRFSSRGSSTLTLPADKSVRLVGASARGTVIRSSSPTQPIVLALGDDSSIEAMTIESTANPPGTGTPSRGVVVGRTTGNLTRFALHDCIIRNTPGYGLYIQGTEASPWLVVLCNYSRVRVTGNKSEGGIWVGKGVTTQCFDDCSVLEFKGTAFRAQEGAGLTLGGCLFERSLDNASAYVVLDSASSVSFDRCWFESYGVATQYFIQLLNASRMIEVRTTRFSRNDGNSVARLIAIDGLNRGVVLVNLEVLMTLAPTGTDDIKVVNSSSEVILISGVIAEPNAFHPIRVNGAPPRSAWLGTNQRVRIPSATTAELSALTDVTNGDIVYNSSTNSLMARINGEWKNITATV